jgi:hypothetical protein
MEVIILRDIFFLRTHLTRVAGIAQSGKCLGYGMDKQGLSIRFLVKVRDVFFDVHIDSHTVGTGFCFLGGKGAE